MIQENVFREVDRIPFSTFPEFANLEKGISYRRRGRQKFEVSKNLPLSCRGDFGELSWGVKHVAFGTGLRAKDDPPNSTDEMFREAAEKVDKEIVIDKRIYGGAPCVANTRVPIYAILEMVEAGYTHKRILKVFPSINKEGLEAALRFAVLVMER